MPSTVENDVRPVGAIKKTRAAGNPVADATEFVEDLPADAILMQGKRQATLVFGGEGAANDIVLYYVYLYEKVRNPNTGETLGYMRFQYCAGTATIGTDTGVGSNEGISSSERICDTISDTPGDYEVFLEAQFGRGNAVFSPADNTVAQLGVGDVGNAVAIEVDFGEAGDPSFCLINLGA